MNAVFHTALAFIVLLFLALLFAGASRWVRERRRSWGRTRRMWFEYSLQAARISEELRGR